MYYSISMSKTSKKIELLKTIPNCPRCGCKMIVLNKKPINSYPSHAAMLYNNGLICFQCLRIEDKKKELDKLPFYPRMKKKLDMATGIPSWIKRTRKRINNWWYLGVLGNKPKKGH